MALLQLYKHLNKKKKDHDFASIILYIATTDTENMMIPMHKRPYFSFLFKALYALYITNTPTKPKINVKTPIMVS